MGIIVRATPENHLQMIAAATSTSFFTNEEIECLKVDLTCSESATLACVNDTRDVIGFAQYGRLEITDRAWCLFWIAVDNKFRGSGVGSKLLSEVEKQITYLNGRVLFIETSSKTSYEPTRQFYLRHNYTVAASIKDYYSSGDSKVIFSKYF